MPDQLTGAFGQLKRTKEKVLRRQEFILLNGRKVSAIVATITATESFMSGGEAQQGGFKCQIAAQDVAFNQPAKFTPIEVRGVELEVLSCDDINGVVYELLAGDPNAK